MRKNKNPKKFISILFSLIMVFALAGCSQETIDIAGEILGNIDEEYSSNYPFFAMIGNNVMGMGPALLLLPNIVEMFPDSGTIPNGTYNLKIELLGDYEVENSILPEANYWANEQDLSYDIDTEFITTNGGVINIQNDRVDGNVFTLDFVNMENINTALINNYINYTSFTDFSQAENSTLTLSNSLISGQNRIDLVFNSNNVLDVLSGILYNVKTVDNPEYAYLIYPCVMKETRRELLSGDTPGIGAYYNESGSPRIMPYDNLATLINSASSIEVILNEIDDNPENDTVYSINKSDLEGSFTYEYNNISYIGFSKIYAQTEGFTKESLVSGGYATLDQLSCLDDKCGIIIYSLNGQYNITIETSTDISADKLFRFGLKLIF
jgi:hypothetical protein